ncbi:hypothetical protein E1B28_007040 [Marasmius oreades]|uniref:Uncharacterized protein n=1 Tax=Marasmius oreades TaxID=181124 RepID=A0A9P7S2H8_9AGAR|nr:uncharacterized protein E1B28_007040 [Marasmius oreades]KAG7093358.1 hypothetical protein E1B28_007040 [Marasmius oreades]
MHRNQRKPICSEDQQPNENINKRLQDAPPAILVASSRTQTASSGRKRGWVDRGSTRWVGRRRNHGRGRGGWNWGLGGHDGNNPSEGSSRFGGKPNAGGFHSFEGIARDDRNFGSFASSSTAYWEATGGESCTDTFPHRMPTLGNFTGPRNGTKAKRKFTPQRPQRSTIPTTSSPLLGESVSLFTPPPSPRREPSSLPFEEISSIFPQATPECRSPSQGHSDTLTPRLPTPHRSSHSHSSPRQYRDIAVQAEEEKVLIPRKRTLISSPVLGATVLPAHPSSPKRLKASNPKIQTEVKVERRSPVAVLVSASPSQTPPSVPHSLSNNQRESQSSSEMAMLEPGRAIKLESAIISIFEPVGVNPGMEIPIRHAGPQAQVIIKRERSPSPLPSPPRLKLTSRAEWFPLPDNCQKSHYKWVDNRMALFQCEAAKFTRRRFKITKQLWRPDGLVIEWTSPCSVWSDTLEPTSPGAAPTTFDDEDVEFIDLTSGDPSLRSSSSAQGDRSGVPSSSITPSHTISTTSTPGSPGTVGFQAPPDRTSENSSSLKITPRRMMPPLFVGAPQPNSSISASRQARVNLHHTPNPSLPTTSWSDLKATLLAPSKPSGKAMKVNCETSAASYAADPPPTSKQPISLVPQWNNTSGQPLIQMLRAAAATLHSHGMDNVDVSSLPLHPYYTPCPSKMVDNNALVNDLEPMPAESADLPVEHVNEDSDVDDVPLLKRLQHQVTQPSSNVKEHQPPKIPRPATSLIRNVEDSNDSDDDKPPHKRYRRKQVSVMPPQQPSGLMAASVSRADADTCSHHYRIDVSNEGNGIKMEHHEMTFKRNGYANVKTDVPLTSKSHPRSIKPWAPPAKSLVPPRQVTSRSWSLFDSDCGSDGSLDHSVVGGGTRGEEGDEAKEMEDVQNHLVRTSPSSNS